MTFRQHEVGNLRNVFVRTLYGVSRRHHVLVVVLSDKLSSLYVFYVLSLMFRLGNKNHSPVTIIIHNFNNAAIWLYAGVRTTNDDAFLNDSTGNRRFLPIDVNEGSVETAVWDGLDEEEVSQIWAEAKKLFDGGENIMEMPEEVRATAVEKQDSHSIDNPLIGVIGEFLEKRIPIGWNKKSIEERMKYFRATDEFNEEVEEKETTRRYSISAIEIWCECLQRDKEDMQFTDSVRIIDALKTLGWDKDDKQHRIGPYGKQRCYHRPYDPDDTELPF